MWMRSVWIVVAVSVITVGVAESATALPSPTTLDGPVHALVEHDGLLIAGGAFRHAGGAALGSLAAWTGTRWIALGEPLDGPVHALVVFQGRLVAAGAFRHAGATPVAFIARWNGTAWEPVGGGTDGAIRALAVHADLFLYAGGRFADAGGVPAASVARFYGGEWSAVGAGLDGEVRALVLFAGTLVAGGDFSVRDGGGLHRHLALFTAGKWRTPALGIDAPVSALAVHGVSLVAAGGFSQIDLVTPARGIARWTGGTWTPLGFGFEPGSEVRALAVAGDAVVAGGTFTRADLRPAAFVARFDGNDWSELGGGTDAPVTAFTSYAGGLVAGGEFARAGDVAAAGVAAWCSDRWQPLRATPVALHAFSVVATASGLEVVSEWSHDAAATLRAVAVERAATAVGPWRRFVVVAPAPVVRVTDRTPDAREPWYRAVAITASGDAVVSAPLQWVAPPARTTMQLTAAPGLDIDVALAVPGPMRLAIFDVRGRRVRVLADGPHPAGRHRWSWDATTAVGTTAARGVWFVRLEAADACITRKWVHARR